MASLNKVYLIGNLTRDPESRVTPKGTTICQFGIAVSRKYKDDSGAQKEETSFVDIEAWGKQGELVAKYLTKGKPCLVEGRLKLDTWDDKTSGQKRSKLKVVLENVQFLGSRTEGEATPQQDERGEVRTFMKPSAPAPAPATDETEIPF